MRNILLALTTGILAGQFFTFYREIKLNRAVARDSLIDEVLEGNYPIIDHEPAPVIGAKVGLYK